MKNKAFQKTLSFILIVVMLLFSFSTAINAQSINAEEEETDIAFESKLSEELRDYLETISDDEYVPIYVWLKNYEENMFYTLLSKRLGANITAQTEDSYVESKVLAKQKAFEKRLYALTDSSNDLQMISVKEMDIKSLSPQFFRTQANISEIMTDTEIQNCINSGMSADEIINISERNQYLSDYRTTRKALNVSVNESFYNLLNLNDCKNIILDPLLTTVRMDCKKSYVYEIAKMATVDTINFENENVSYKSFSAHDDVSYNVDNLGYYMTPHQSLGYDGAGIRVGVLEVGDNLDSTKVMFDTNNPHLMGDRKSVV